MKLTCVTAVRNAIEAGRRDALVRCIESVAQLKTPHEHLVYDGASTDGSSELLKKLEATTPGLNVVSEPDSGIYNALNKGVRDAHGEWFYVLGCDDHICCPDVLDTLLEKSSSIDMSVSPTYDDIIGDNLRIVILRNIFVTTPYPHQGVIVRTRWLRRFGGFDERYRICADFDFLLKMHKAATRIAYFKQPFAVYSKGGFSGDRANSTADARRVAQSHFAMTPATWRYFDRTHCVPPSLFIRYLLHRDYALRTAARVMCWTWTKNQLRVPFYPIVVARRKWMANRKCRP